MLHPSMPLPERGLIGFADLDALDDVAGYIAFLDGFQRSCAEMVEAGIELLHIPRGGAVLDVGCGHGAAFARLGAKTGSGGRVVGLDASRSLIDEARRRWLGSAWRTELHVGDAHTLPFDDAAFDAVRADRVLVFLREPGAALAEMVRVAAPGARIVVSEADLGSAAVDACDVSVTRAVLAEACDAVPNGHIGRRLRGLFLDGGLEAVEVRLFDMQSTNLPEWSRRVGLAGAVQRAVQRGVIGSDAAATWVADLERRDAAGRFFATSLFFMACGRKPDAAD
jgi:SAM-dependent methyltransferase